MATINRGSGSGLSTRPSSDLFFDPFRRMRELFELGSLPGMEQGGELAFTPSFEVKERGDAYQVRADLPGVKEADLDISITSSRLTVSGKREAERREENERVHVYETSYGSFTRSFELPDNIDTEHAQADLKDGVLTVMLPKATKGQARKLEVGKAKGSGGQVKA